MNAHLLLTVRLHDGRFHGMHEWPPSPARVFQALVAGCARGSNLPDSAVRALDHLERLEPPLIVAPGFRLGQEYDSFVPNNDADTLKGDLSKLPDIRREKTIRARLLEGEPTFLYSWDLPDVAAAPVDEIVEASHQLFQLGRGVDLAWADAEVVSPEQLAGRIEECRGEVFRPSGGESSTMLACPTRGTLRSLMLRFRAAQTRLSPSEAGTILFTQPPKAHFRQVVYGGGAARLLYELRAPDGEDLQAWPVWRVTALVERLREGAAAKLRDALPARSDVVDQCLVGRRGEGATLPRDARDARDARVRLWPLPSIGHTHADQGIRRVAVTVPAEAGLSVGDVHWAFTGLEPCDPVSGEVDPIVVTPAVDGSMLGHYVEASRCWRSVTPLALPEVAKRRRIDPSRRLEESKGATERADEEARARVAVVNALRHAGVVARPVRIDVQREPFDRKGARAERFESKPRFPKERLWYVRARFAEPVEGLLALGDGRYLGLGLMAPVPEAPAAYSLWIERGLEADADAVGVARALRRAVMARVQAILGGESLPPFFSGHAHGGAQSEHPHLVFQAELPYRLLVLTPEAAGTSSTRTPRRFCRLLDQAVAQLREVRAGAAGLLQLTARALDLDEDALCGHATRWDSVSPYAVNRHRKVGSPAEAITLDVLAECARRRLPAPTVTVASVSARPGSGLEGRLSLQFARPVGGPLVMGRTRHLGGGLFRPVNEGQRDVT